MKALLICSLFFLVILIGGCDKAKEKAKAKITEAASQAVAAGAARLAQEYEEAKVVEYARQFVAAVDAKDLDKLKGFCTDPANADYNGIMGCYYNAFAIENSQGVGPARKYLADETAKPDNPPARAKALAALNAYFDAKGSAHTKECAALILIIGLEAKYPHYGGKIGKLIGEKLGLTNLPKPATESAPAR